VAIKLELELEPGHFKPNARGYNGTTLFLGGNKYRDLAHHVVGVSQIETIKYAHESRGTQT
jgi:hypothetical protein